MENVGLISVKVDKTLLQTNLTSPSGWDLPYIGCSLKNMWLSWTCVHNDFGCSLWIKVYFNATTISTVDSNRISYGMVGFIEENNSWPEEHDHSYIFSTYDKVDRGKVYEDQEEYGLE